MKFEGFVGPTYQARSWNHNLERCVNLIPEAGGGAAKSRLAYYQTPGLTTRITIPGAPYSSPIRCLWAGDDRVLAVAGALYGEIRNTAGVLSWEPRGAVNNDNRPAQIYANGRQVVVQSGGGLYCDNGGDYNGANLVYQIPSNWATYIDGYFLSLQVPSEVPGAEVPSNQFQLSALLNGLDPGAWDPLDYARRLGTQDRVVALANDGDKLWLFGRRTISPWYNSGNADFPFAPVPGATISQGLVVPHSLAELDGSFFFVAEDDRGGAMVVRTEGFQLKRVSTHAIERGLLNPFYDKYCAWIYEQEGHKFYVLTEYGGGQNSQTWVYDVTTDLWHERAHWDGSGFEAHEGRCHCYSTPGWDGLGGLHLVGSRSSGRVYVQSMQYYTDDGDPIRRYRQAPHLSDEEKWVFYHRFKLDMSIVGTPDITLKWSDNDGVTWTADKSPVFTAIPDEKKRAIWRRLGRSRDRIFAITIHGFEGPVTIVDAFLDLTQGTS